MFKRYWKLDKHVLTLLCCKNYYVCLIETENKQKEAKDGPFDKIFDN